MLIESNYYLNYKYLKLFLKKSQKIYFKCLRSIIAHILKMEEDCKYLLGIIQTSTCNLNIK